MTDSQYLSKVNTQLAREHGRTGTHANYRWFRSPDLSFMRHTGKYDYKADQVSGLVTPVPLYEKRPQYPELEQTQWVLARWLSAPSPSDWHSALGVEVEYPEGGGYYARTNIILDPGINPWDEARGETLTDWLCHSIKYDRDKRLQQLQQEADDIIERREAASDKALEEKIMEAVLPFPNAPHVPGRRGGPVSLPTTRQDA